MSNVAVVSFGTTNGDALYARDVITELGHAVTNFDSVAVTASNLSAFDLIVIVNPDEPDFATIIPFLEGYISTDTIPFVFLADMLGAPSSHQCASTAPSAQLGAVANVHRNGGATGFGYQLRSDFAARNKLLPLAGAGEHIVGEAFLTRDVRTGNFPAWGGNGVAIGSACGSFAAVAGTHLMEAPDDTANSVHDASDEVCCAMIDVGDERVGAGTYSGGTWPVRAAYVGCASLGQGCSTKMSALVQAAVKWALGDYAAVTTYSTTLLSALRYRAVDISAAGTYSSSAIDWTQDLPASTAVVVKASLDGENFTNVSKGGAIPGLSASDDLTDVVVHLVVELQTSDSGATPRIKDVTIEVVGEAAALTASPTTYFDFGQLRWTSGLNEGLAMEIKTYDPSTRTLTLALPMPFDVATLDQFDVYPGCDKTRATCASKFSNAVNFQGEPDVPGEDKIRERPDARPL